MVFSIFRFCITLSVPEKLIFEIPLIPQTSNINLRITSVKSITLDTIKILIKYSLKNILVKKINVLLPFWRYSCSKKDLNINRPVGTGSKRVKTLRVTKIGKIRKVSKLHRKYPSAEINILSILAWDSWRTEIELFP